VKEALARPLKHTMPSRVSLAFAKGAEHQARNISAQLSALGYEVGPVSARGKKAAPDKVVMVWSRAALGTPALRAAARKAHAAGKLVCIRLDSAPPPVHGAPGAKLTNQIKWRRLLTAKARPAEVVGRPARARIQTARAKRTKSAAQTVDAKPSARPAAATVGTDMQIYSESTSRTFAIVLALLLVGAVGLGLAYARYPAVAAPIDSAATAAYEQASEIAAKAP
jgi:hypothetical protein